MATTIALPAGIARRQATPRRTSRGRAILTLAARRAALTAHNPRQIAVPLVGPALLALVVAPALKVATGGLNSHLDYTSFVGVGAVGLVVPLSCIFAGLSVIVDRHSGAQRELLAAPHAVALLRDGLVDPHGSGLHDIWGMSNVTAEAWLSLGVVALFAAAFVAIAVRSFTRSAVH